MPHTTTIEPIELPTGAHTGHPLPALAALVEAATVAREQAAPLVEEVAYLAERVEVLLGRYEEIREPVARLAGLVEQLGVTRMQGWAGDAAMAVEPLALPSADGSDGSTRSAPTGV